MRWRGLRRFAPWAGLLSHPQHWPPRQRSAMKRVATESVATEERQRRHHRRAAAPKKQKKVEYPVARQLRWSAAQAQALLDAEQRRVTRSKARCAVDRCSTLAQDSGVVDTLSGRKRLASFEAAFRHLFEHSDPPVRLGDLQEKLIKEVTVALLPQFFKKDLVENIKWLRKKYVIDVLSETVSAVCPRRQGKTEGCAIIAAVLAVSQPRGNSVMFNLTGTQAKDYLQSVQRYLDVRALAAGPGAAAPEGGRGRERRERRYGPRQRN